MLNVIFFHRMGGCPGRGMGPKFKQCLEARGHQVNLIEPRAQNTIRSYLAAAPAAESLDGPVIVAGHSYGGKAAVHYAKKNRSVSAVVALAPVLGWRDVMMRGFEGMSGLSAEDLAFANVGILHAQSNLELRMIQQALKSGPNPLHASSWASQKRVDKQLAKRVNGGMALDYKADLPLYREIMNMNESGIEQRVRCPVLVVAGTRDKLLNPRANRRLVATSPGSKLATFPVEHGLCGLSKPIEDCIAHFLSSKGGLARAA